MLSYLIPPTQTMDQLDDPILLLLRWTVCLYRDLEKVSVGKDIIHRPIQVCIGIQDLVRDKVEGLGAGTDGTSCRKTSSEKIRHTFLVL